MPEGVNGGSPKWERPKEATFLELKGKTYAGDGECFFFQGQPEDAEAKIRAEPETYLGYQTDALATYVFVLKKGTTFRLYDSPASTLFILREPQLPTTDEVECFEDDFTSCDTCGDECAFARPGRCEGLKDTTADLCLFSTVSPGDIRQGTLGDCWLLSAMSALAEYPQAVMRIFSPKCLAIDGKYDITLFHPVEDTFVHVNIDDRLPIDSSGGVKYCKLTDADEIWPCLLEKAMAKMFGSYACLNGNHPLIALKAFTQCADLMEISSDDGQDQWQARKPVFKMLPRSCWDRDADEELAYDEMEWPDTGVKGHDRRPLSDFYCLLASYDKANYLLCASSQIGGKDDSDLSDLGIVYGHAYALLSVEKDVAGSGVDLMQLRNPWGSREWRGDWSDNSEMWDQHPAVAEALDHGAEDDGQFWISSEDFVKNFQYIYVIRAEMPLSRTKAKKHARTADTASNSAIPSPDGKPARRTLNVHVDCIENFDNALKQGMRKARIPESEFAPLLCVIEDSSGSKFPLGSETACSFPVRIRYPVEQMHDELVSSRLRKRLGASGFELFAKDAETRSEEFLSVVRKFQEYDTDGNGIISEEELMSVLIQLMPDRSEDDLRSLFAAADANSDGNIDYEELVAWMYVT